MGKIRWLHISDLHYDREMMGDWPAGQNGFPVTGIDFIVFTGDLHTYGRDYNEGKRFLTELAKHYNLNPISCSTRPAARAGTALPLIRSSSTRRTIPIRSWFRLPDGLTV